MILENIVALLPHVSRPIQYLGHELNAVHKSWEAIRVKVGLCFPDAYEVGMSHLGLHLLYSLLNARNDVLAERVYAPFPDMEALMRKHGVPLFSLESHQPAAAFDILGFTLQYELSYSNVLNMLSLTGIPLRSERRREHDPLIIAGGPCSFNPEPLADICDLFVIGDGEETVLQLIDVYQEWKGSGSRKHDLLRNVCALPGVYVPAFYQVQYADAGQIDGIVPTIPEAPERVSKATVPTFDQMPYLQAPIVPYLKTVHDRLTLEIMRGCARGCRFCQAGYIYRPVREKSPDVLQYLTKTLLQESGYDEVSLSSLSTGDYSQITSLVASVMNMCEASRVSVALPSMRVSTLTEQLASIIRRVRKTGFTIAPEAGTQRLRNVINKGITDEDILETVEEAFNAGWELLKLYFMIGLPTETAEDIDGLIDLVHRVHQTARRAAKHSPSNKRGAKLNVSFSSFIPKAHTPFQWDRFDPNNTLHQKQRLLQDRIRHRAIQLKWHDVETSYLEAVFARGDRRLGRVLEEAHRLGCKFDGWHEHFDYSAWTQAFASTNIDPGMLALREYRETEHFPWDHIETGVSREFLWQERLKALKAEGSPPCTPHCRRCGLCHDNLKVIRTTKRQSTEASSGPKAEDRPKTFRVRAVYAKTGLLRFLSHLDTGRVFQRAVARINTPIAYSQGFHPHPLISFGPALPVGTEGQHEYVDFYFIDQIDVDQFVRKMNATLPAGIYLHKADAIDLQDPSLSAHLTQFVYEITLPEALVCQKPAAFTVEELIRTIMHFHAQESWWIKPFKKRADGIDIKPFIDAFDVHPDDSKHPQVHLALTVRENITLKPEEVLHLVLHIPYEQVLDCRIVRIMCS